MSEPSGGTFQEASLRATPLRDLGLTIAGTRLEPILAEFLRELEQVGIRKLRPEFYLSTEWGVAEDTIAIAIPFYLARPDLLAMHEQHAGLVEGNSPRDILRYLRHEMGHVINYGYHLYGREEWVQTFGAMTRPYVDEYRPEPFSTRFVRHLPGWYAQKHPDEDWAETFAVWMTPGLDWQAEYGDWPEALAKLRCCDRLMTEIRAQEPTTTAATLDEDVGTLEQTLSDFYPQPDDGSSDNYSFPAALDGALRTIFDDLQPEDGGATAPAAALMRRCERDLITNVYRWTGHFPERTKPLLHHLMRSARRLELGYRPEAEPQAVIALTTLLTALAMSWVLRGSYLP